MGKDQELLEAARNGNIPIVEKILSQRAKRSGPLASLRRGPGANVQDSSGYSALHHAALNGHREAVELLLAHEASVNIVDGKGSSPLHLAAWAGNDDVVRLLLCRGPSVPKVNLTTKDNETALHCAAQYGHTVVVALLLEHGCDPSIRNCREETALDLAAQYGRLETVELLLRTHPELLHQYTEVSPNTVFSHTPLHRASRNGHKAVVVMLLKAGFPVSALSPAGTALHEAALCGKLEVVRCLLERGVALNAKDTGGLTVLEVLAQFPAHLTHEMSALITRHKHRKESNATLPSPAARGTEEDKENAEPLPPIPNNTMGSPYDNVKLTPRGGRVAESPGAASPSHWNFYDTPGKTGEDRRVPGASAMSVPLRLSRGSDSGLYQSSPAPTVLAKSLDSSGFMARSMESSVLSAKSMDSSCLSEELSELSSSRLSYPVRDADQLSVSSSSSMGGPSISPRDRFLPMDRGDAGNYMPMSGRSSNNSVVKVSPTPPKKPPRRNLSVSPTHGELGSNYEYLFLARSGEGREAVRRGRSTDQYVDMRLRQNAALQLASSGGEDILNEEIPRHRRSDSAGEESMRDLEPQPTERRHTTIGQYDNSQRPHNYPRRKLRRNNDRAYENFDPNSQDGGPTFVSSAYIRLRPSQENMVEAGELAKKKKLVRVPLSPTHYKQPPTPDHPPPSALDAERSIHDRIRPLSQEYKRRSRDIETETEEDLLLFSSLGASSGSLSSSISISDRSVSTDYVEEYIGDVPFAGLLKGSTTTSTVITSDPSGVECRIRPLERPKTLRRIRNVYDTTGELSTSHINSNVDTEVINDRNLIQPSTDKSLSILSPFDEQEEWNKISEIMASFGTGLVRESVFVSELEKEFQCRLGLNRSDSAVSPCTPSYPTTVGQWFANIHLPQYEEAFIKHGYDDLGFIRGVLQPSDLTEMGVIEAEHVTTITTAMEQLTQQLQRFGRNGARVPASVDDWLKAIRLECYAETFRKHLYTDMQRVLRIWDVEVTTLLDIDKLGHRRRILASVGAAAAALADLGHAEHAQVTKNTATTPVTTSETSQSNEESTPATTTTTAATTSTVVVSGTGTLRHSHKKSRPAPPPPCAAPAPTTSNGNGENAALTTEDLSIREPGELLVGMPSTLTTQWRHRPHSLVTGYVTYTASYLGSTLVKELRGTESTKKSIQKLKRAVTSRENKQTPDVVLSISYRGVQFLDATTKELVCEHEIRNIHCACQDADDLTHFAYITKDHSSKDHYCHVFCVKTMDQATEVILTLGQAFEVAYQMALRDQFNNSSSTIKPGHTRSQSAQQAVPRCMSLSNGSSTNNNNNNTTTSGTTTNGTHTRSHSVNGIIRVEPTTPVKEITSQSTVTVPISTQSPRAPIVFTEDM